MQINSLEVDMIVFCNFLLENGIVQSDEYLDQGSTNNNTNKKDDQVGEEEEKALVLGAESVERSFTDPAEDAGPVGCGEVVKAPN